MLTATARGTLRAKTGRGQVNYGGRIVAIHHARLNRAGRVIDMRHGQSTAPTF